MRKGVTKVSLHCEGCLQWLLSIKYCNDVWAKRELLFGILGLNGVTCLDVRGKRRNVLHCLVNNGFYLGFDKGLAYDAIFMGSQDLQIVFQCWHSGDKVFGVWHSPCLKLGGFVTLGDGCLSLNPVECRRVGHLSV